MSAQQFSIGFRHALWEAHKQKCFYCTKGIMLLEMEVDHVLPESLDFDPQQLQEVKQRLGLPDEFQITGFANLVPACRACNGRKKHNLLPDGRLSIELTRVREVLPKLQAALEKRRVERDLESALIAVARSVESGKFTADGFIAGLQAMVPATERAPTEEALIQSPEILAYGVIPDTSKIAITHHARKQLKNSKLALRDINEVIQMALFYRTLSAQRLTLASRGGKRVYEIRGRDNLRVFYALEKDQVIILGFYNKRSGKDEGWRKIINEYLKD
jgi:hypothetical protein